MYHVSNKISKGFKKKKKGNDILLWNVLLDLVEAYDKLRLEGLLGKLHNRLKHTVRNFLILFH